MTTSVRAETTDVRQFSEPQRAAAYLSGDDQVVEKLWWLAHWSWQWSEGHQRLCSVNEAIATLAWETCPPVLTPEGELIFEAVAELNAFARTVPFTNGQKQIYWLKRDAIRDAMKRGLASLRKIEWRGDCRTCDGSGTYIHYFAPHETEYSRCRRCSGRGYVRLYFHEVNIANRFTFHQPDDSTTPFGQEQTAWLQPHPALTWKPNQPGRKLDWEQATDLVKFLKLKYWLDQPCYVKEIYTYMNQEPNWL